MKLEELLLPLPRVTRFLGKCLKKISKRIFLGCMCQVQDGLGKQQPGCYDALLLLLSPL